MGAVQKHTSIPVTVQIVMVIRPWHHQNLASKANGGVLFASNILATRDKLLKHVETVHKKKSKNGFRCSRCYIQYDIEQEYHIHMQQHMLDDRRELKAIKSQNKKRKG